jgi:hypothetical protein
MLTPDEAAADEAVRRQIADEFPPAQRAYSTSSSLFSEVLKKSIRESGRSLSELATAVGISENLLDLFLTGGRDIHMKTADRLAAVLALEVTARR